MIYREYTECYSISFLFLFFFHQSSLYPIKIFAKCFYLLVHYVLETVVFSYVHVRNFEVIVVPCIVNERCVVALIKCGMCTLLEGDHQ